MALVTTENVSILRKLGDLLPSENLTNLHQIILSYAIADEEAVPPANAFKDIKNLTEKYHREMDSNAEIEKNDWDLLEEALEILEFRYHMGLKLDTFNVKELFTELFVEKWKEEPYATFVKLPWLWVLEKMNEEKRVPVVFERHKHRENNEELRNTMPMNSAFKKAYSIVWRSRRPETHILVTRPLLLDTLIRSHHDLLHLAQDHARRSLKGVPKLGELRKAGRWEELSRRIEDLETDLTALAALHGITPYEITVDLVDYKRIWYDTYYEESWDVSEYARIDSTSTREQRVRADIDRLVGECVWVSDDPTELAALIRKFGEHVAKGEIGIPPPDDLESGKDLVMENGNLLAVRSPDTFLDVLVRCCGGWSAGHRRSNNSLSSLATLNTDRAGGLISVAGSAESPQKSSNGHSATSGAEVSTESSSNQTSATHSVFDRTSPGTNAVVRSWQWLRGKQGKT